MRIVFSLLAAAAATAALPALAGERPPRDNAAETEAAKAEKKICRRISTDISSRRQERVCLTAEEWRQRNQAN